MTARSFAVDCSCWTLSIAPAMLAAKPEPPVDAVAVDAPTALSDPAPVPMAVLRIPKIRLEAPVLPGTDDSTLDRAVGHIVGTAKPGTVGNSGIAGHRDGFFRGLKDMVPGDVIELDTIQGNDDATGAVLYTRSLSSFQNGAYLVWTIQGNVKFKVVNTGPNNAVISGLFFG